MSLCFSGAKEYHLHLAIEATNTVCEMFYFPSVSLATWSSLHVMQLLFVPSLATYFMCNYLICVLFHNKRSQAAPENHVTIAGKQDNIFSESVKEGQLARGYSLKIILKKLWLLAFLLQLTIMSSSFFSCLLEPTVLVLHLCCKLLQDKEHPLLCTVSK